MAGVRKEAFEEELREEGREVIPAEERRSYEREREEGDSTVAPVAIRVPSTLDVCPRAARPPSSSGTPAGDAHFHRAASER